MTRRRRNQEQLLKDEGLIFVDTNILLDFYRMDAAKPDTKWLRRIEENIERLISTCQVEMEFKKNRQEVILKTKKEFKAPDLNSLKVPPILAEDAAAKALKNAAKELTSRVKAVERKLKNLLDNQKSDQIYSALEKTIFAHKGPYILDRDHESRRRLKHKARTRFLLGYPPRKDKDNSYGDALNWEWIVHVASESAKPIIIVTRDSDYGHFLNGSGTLNSWLKEEFGERVGPKRTIVLTNRLAEAFRLIGVTIPERAVEHEREILSSSPAGEAVSSPVAITYDAE